MVWPAGGRRLWLSTSFAWCWYASLTLTSSILHFRFYFGFNCSRLSGISFLTGNLLVFWDWCALFVSIQLWWWPCTRFGRHRCPVEGARCKWSAWCGTIFLARALIRASPSAYQGSLAIDVALIRPHPKVNFVVADPPTSSLGEPDPYNVEIDDEGQRDLLDMAHGGKIDVRSGFSADVASIRNKCNEYSIEMYTTAANDFKLVMCPLSILCENRKLLACVDHCPAITCLSKMQIQLLHDQVSRTPTESNSEQVKVSRFETSIEVANPSYPRLRRKLPP